MTTSLFGVGSTISVNVQGTVAQEHFSAAVGQTVFNLTNFVYTPNTNSLFVFINGRRQQTGRDFNETSSTSITFLEALLGTEKVDVVGFPTLDLQAVTAGVTTYVPPYAGSTLQTGQSMWDFFLHINEFRDFSTLEAAFVSALQASVASGRVLYLDGNTTYSLSVAQLSIPAGTRLQTNGATLQNALTNTSDDVWLSVAGNVNIDKLNILLPTTVVRDRLVEVSGADITIGSIEINSVDVQTTTSADDHAVKFVDCTNLNILSIKTTNYDRALTFTRITGGKCNRIDVSSFVRGLYCVDVKNFTFASGVIATASPNASVTAGHNAILVSTETDDATDCLHFGNWVAKNAGEHGIRFAGPKKCGKITVDTFYISGHGGCGFKLLGTDTTAPTDRNASVFINELIIEDGGVSTSSAKTNRCGALIQFADYVRINNFVCRPKANTFSASYGIRITACTWVTIGNYQIKKTRFSGIILDGVDGDIEDVYIGGGISDTNSVHGLEVVTGANTLRRTTLNVDANNNVDMGFNIDATGGTIVDMTLNVKTYNNTNGCGDCNSAAVTMNGKGPVGGAGLPASANNGSIWQDGTTVQIRKGGAWSAL